MRRDLIFLKIAGIRTRGQTVQQVHPGNRYFFLTVTGINSDLTVPVKKRFGETKRNRFKQQNERLIRPTYRA